MARRLLSGGATFVQVSHANYDTHNENFDFHLEQVGEFDRSFAALVADLADRGMLDSTLIVVLESNLAARHGSITFMGAIIGPPPGACWWPAAECNMAVRSAKRTPMALKSSEHQVDHAQLFHTYLTAVGLDPTDSFDIGGRPMPMADPASAAIKELLA